MRFLKTINKFIEGFLWLYLPVVLLYWTVLLTNFPALNPIKMILGLAVNPAINIINSYFNFQVIFRASKIDYTPLIAALIVFVLALIFGGIARVLDFIENFIDQEKIKAYHRKEIAKKQKQKEEYLMELDKNKTIYVMLKLSKINKHETYLVKEESDPFSVGLVDSYEATIANIASKFNGKLYNGYEAEEGVYNLIFSDLNKVLDYIPFLMNKVEEINKGTADLNTIFTYQLACSCSYSHTTADTDLVMTEKVLNLCANKDILITELLKDKLEYYESNKNYRFESKGIYHICEKFVDVYKLILG